MTNTQKVPSRALGQSDVELIERIVCKTADDLAVSMARSLERLEERIDAAESRLYTRLNDLEDQVARANSPAPVLTA